jgi:hypothetical protein
MYSWPALASLCRPPLSDQAAVPCCNGWANAWEFASCRRRLPRPDTDFADVVAAADLHLSTGCTTPNSCMQPWATISSTYGSHEGIHALQPSV